MTPLNRTEHYRGALKGLAGCWAEADEKVDKEVDKEVEEEVDKEVDEEVMVAGWLLVGACLPVN